MATTHPAAPTEATTFDEYQKVVDIVNNGFKDALSEILKKLGDPHAFDAHVRSLARHGYSLEGMSDTSHLLDSFWQTTTGVNARMTWMNGAGVPERSRQYVEQIVPTPALSVAPVTHWGISLPFGIGFYT
ncbi:hypothetical protein ACWCPJ_35935 [Streptomyces collinus]